MNLRTVPGLLALMASLLGFTGCASSSEPAPVYRLTIVGNRFEPQQLEIPANRQTEIAVKNTDSDLRFFYSYSLNRTKPVRPGAEQMIYLRPLAPGSYEISTQAPGDPRGSILVK